MDNRPAPLTPTDCDLRGMEWMPLHGHKLYGSDFDAIASDAEYRAAQRLWWAAWQQQVPAASLPNDERVLAHIAGYGRDPKGWTKIKAVALHAFVECSDGRLYHRFLAPEAIIAWEKRVKERARKADYRAKKAGQDTAGTPPVPRDNHGTDAGHDADGDGDFRADNTTQDRTGQFKKERKETSLRSVAPDRACRLPDDWQPSADARAYAADLGLNVDRVAEDFRGYWHAKSGKDATKAGLKGWALTWQGWCRREAERRPQAARHPPAAGVKSRTDWDAHDARLAELERELLNQPPVELFDGVTLEGELA